MTAEAPEETVKAREMATEADEVMVVDMKVVEAAVVIGEDVEGTTIAISKEVFVVAQGAHVVVDIWTDMVDSIVEIMDRLVEDIVVGLIRALGIEKGHMGIARDMAAVRRR